MSEFTYACPVCHQHLKCQTSQAGTVMKCPTCYQRIVAPQAPGEADRNLVFTGHRYVEKKTTDIPTMSAATSENQGQKRFPVGMVAAVIGVLAVLAGGGVFMLSHRGAAAGKPVSLANSSFEIPGTSTYIYNPVGGSWTFAPMSKKNGFDNGSGITANQSDFNRNNPLAPAGQQVAFLQGTGTFSQPVPGMVRGRHYTVTFLAAQRDKRFPPSQVGQTWDVRINNMVIGSFAPDQSANSYVNYSAGFTASSDNSTLAFVGTNLKGGDNTVFIDNVQITSP